MNVLTVIETLGAVFGTGGGLYALLTIRPTRRRIDAQASDALAGTMAKLGTTAGELVDDLRAEAREARQEAAAARLEMAMVRAEAEALASELRRWRKAILDPSASLERLRLMVEPGGNGTS